MSGVETLKWPELGQRVAEAMGVEWERYRHCGTDERAMEAFGWLRDYVSERRAVILSYYTGDGVCLTLESADFFGAMPGEWFCGVSIDRGVYDGITRPGELGVYANDIETAVGRALVTIVAALDKSR